MSKRMPSVPQSGLLQLLRTGYVIYEERGKDRHSFSYTTARIGQTAFPAFILPRRIHKETVFALLANGWLKSVKPWKGYDVEVMVLNEKLPLFADANGGEGRMI